jgi:hypothetical protein
VCRDNGSVNLDELTSTEQFVTLTAKGLSESILSLQVKSAVPVLSIERRIGNNATSTIFSFSIKFITLFIQNGRLAGFASRAGEIHQIDGPAPSKCFWKLVSCLLEGFITSQPIVAQGSRERWDRNRSAESDGKIKKQDWSWREHSSADCGFVNRSKTKLGAQSPASFRS